MQPPEVNRGVENSGIDYGKCWLSGDRTPGRAHSTLCRFRGNSPGLQRSRLGWFSWCVQVRKKAGLSIGEIASFSYVHCHTFQAVGDPTGSAYSVCKAFKHRFKINRRSSSSVGVALRFHAVGYAFRVEWLQATWAGFPVVIC